ncbi:MAG: hypothetical protein ACK41W_01945 [Cyanobacteriota bacterium]
MGAEGDLTGRRRCCRAGRQGIACRQGDGVGLIVGPQQAAQARVARAIIRRRQGGEAVAEALLILSREAGEGGEQLFKREGGSSGAYSGMEVEEQLREGGQLSLCQLSPWGWRVHPFGSVAGDAAPRCAGWI